MTLSAELRNYKAGTYEAVEVKTTETPWSGRTVTGFGKQIPTQYMIKFNNRWQRVYCAIFSNSGSLYIKSHKNLSVAIWSA